MNEACANSRLMSTHVDHSDWTGLRENAALLFLERVTPKTAGRQAWA